MNIADRLSSLINHRFFVTTSASQDALRQLQQLLARRERFADRRVDVDVTSPVDQTASATSGEQQVRLPIPFSSIQSGMLVEWIDETQQLISTPQAQEQPAHNGSALAFWLARHWQQIEHAHVMVIDPMGEFYPPGAAGMGLSLENLILLRPAQRDVLWVYEQCLRCPANLVVLGPLGRISPTAYRRLKLAAEQSGNLGLLLRPRFARQHSCWADLRLSVQPLHAEHSLLGQIAKRAPTRWMRVELLQGRGMSIRPVILEINHEGVVSVDSPLAPAATAGHAAIAS